MGRVIILGVPIDCVSQPDAIRHIATLFRKEGQFHIATPNPEMLVEARKNEEFREVLNGTEMNLADGVGIVWAMERWGGGGVGKVKRVTGTDTLQHLCSLSSRICPPERIFLLGAAPGVADKAAEKLKAKNHLLKDIGTFSGSPKKEDEEEVIRRVNDFGPTLLFVAYGAPQQDLWIARNLAKMPTVKVAMGIGGALDFIAGRRWRAPRWMQRMGLEWFFRLILEPWRIVRIWRAVVVFPWLVTCHPRQPLTCHPE